MNRKATQYVTRIFLFVVLTLLLGITGCNRQKRFESDYYKFICKKKMESIYSEQDEQTISRFTEDCFRACQDDHNYCVCTNNSVTDEDLFNCATTEQVDEEQVDEEKVDE